MESDKQIYLIFQWQPQWVFLLLHESPPAGARFESVTLKTIEKRVDAAWIPADDSLAIVVAEFQGYDDHLIFVRIVQEMAMLRSQYPKRRVRGIVVFLESRFEPDSDPWREFVQVIYLDEALEQLSVEQPEHPMVAVLRHCLLGVRKFWKRKLRNAIIESTAPNWTRLRWLGCRKCL